MKIFNIFSRWLLPKKVAGANTCRICDHLSEEECRASQVFHECGIGMTCEVTYIAMMNGKQMYTSHCRNADSCETQQEQNFNGVSKMRNSCVSSNYFGRYVQQSTCTVCVPPNPLGGIFTHPGGFVLNIPTFWATTEPETFMEAIKMYL
ncbi:Oidioi.mRNA.OKI2018_I69.chr1.g1273.t1.cds [Oikopleura dioica]|uniref:Oidioi.mRNA.OKI2018_I69.chr1.g1273.t1.cds n=1 Tax=Oikopleura dioica TaxID=34765 RepID=A0ABN7SQY9_OIKDI|nr:Oidioi.mRNA.OKI2018_I69.chr1.g1273.t1.cds [Oikopleura dioica]